MLNIRENFPLDKLTSFRVGGAASYFASVESEADALEAYDFAKKHDLPIFILGGGTNVIVASGGFKGLVVVPNFTDISFKDEIMSAGASVLMRSVVDQSIAKFLAGCEWAGGLPGTLGGAIRGNAGCFGAEIKDVVQTVTSLDLNRKKKITRKNEECRFGYRESIFKHNPQELIVSATLQLKQGNAPELRAIADSHIDYRQEKHPMEYPSAGSIFKNTPVDKVPKNILPEFENLIKNDPFPVIPTAAIIARADCQGLTIGGAQISTKHTNYIVNLGSATGEDIVAVIEEVKKRVKEKYGIVLEIEPQLLGF